MSSPSGEEEKTSILLKNVSAKLTALFYYRSRSPVHLPFFVVAQTSCLEFAQRCRVTHCRRTIDIQKQMNVMFEDEKDGDVVVSRFDPSTLGYEEWKDAWMMCESTHWSAECELRTAMVEYGMLPCAKDCVLPRWDAFFEMCNGSDTMYGHNHSCKIIGNKAGMTTHLTWGVHHLDREMEHIFEMPMPCNEQMQAMFRESQ